MLPSRFSAHGTANSCANTTEDLQIFHITARLGRLGYYRRGFNLRRPQMSGSLNQKSSKTSTSCSHWKSTSFLSFPSLFSHVNRDMRSLGALVTKQVMLPATNHNWMLQQIQAFAQERRGI
ncbi:uncharacterized protein LOC129310079 [Prosopis cineraria]|uniref:uncharacterized protein LOC129310079 n=1 Tax=Prosopis cineraria TaxID=364024 RepID=UPI00240EA85E|nr:uncharacterized protein LOC129310079 [Prosopis cineraria]